MSVFSRFTGHFVMFIENCSMAIENIRQNRMRSFLTILGIMIGVTAVIALITTISGVSSSISSSFTSMGAGSISVSAPGSDLKGGLDKSDFEEIGKLEHVVGVRPTVSLSLTVARSNTSETSVTSSSIFCICIACA